MSMAIETVAGTEKFDGARSICEVIVTELEYGGGARLIGNRVTRGWEFMCTNCGEMSTNLTERDAEDELIGHVCKNDYEGSDTDG